MPRSDRSFVDQFKFLRPAQCGAHGRLQSSDFCVMTSTQHFEAALAVGTCLEMVVTPRPVSASVARLHVVDFAVASRGITPFSCAAVLRSTLGRGAGKAPDVIALPRATTRITAPRSTTSRNDQGVTPLTASRFALPCRKMTGDSFGYERW
jgi:hypothetical protein